MKMKKEAKDRSKYILFFTLILVILFFLGSDFADAAVSCKCELKTQYSPFLTLDTSTNTGDDCDCAVSCIDPSGNLKTSCNKPEMNGWPKPTLTFIYTMTDGDANHPTTAAGVASCAPPGCQKSGSIGKISVVPIVVDFTPYADPNQYAGACAAKFPNADWGPKYGSKYPTPPARCCGSDSTPGGYVTSATFTGVSGAFSYLCAEEAGRYLWVSSSNENAGKVYIIDEGTPGQYDVVVRESSGFYSCKGSGAASTAAKIDAGNSVVVTKYSAAHSFLCDDFARFLECKKESDSFFNTISSDRRTYSSGNTIAVSKKDFLCYDGAWYDIATITPQTVTSRGVCEAVVGDTPSMGWIGDKDTGGAWCCFKTGQYMGNAVNGKSCWDGRVIENGEIIDGTENKVINDKGKFFYCAGDAAAIAGINPLSEGLVWGTTAGVSGGWPPKESSVSRYYNEPLSNRGPYFTLTSSGRNYIKLPAKIDSTVTISVWGKIS